MKNAHTDQMIQAACAIEYNALDLAESQLDDTLLEGIARTIMRQIEVGSDLATMVMVTANAAKSHVITGDAPATEYYLTEMARAFAAMQDAK